MNRPWSDVEINKLISYYPDNGKKATSILLNRSEASIRAKASELKVKLNKSYQIGHLDK